MARRGRIARFAAVWVLGIALTACAGADEFNIAPLGTAMQSTVGYGGVPERAIDGNTSGVYNDNSITHTATGDAAPWWELDLGDEYEITRIVIWNRTDVCCPQRLSNFYVSVLDDGYGEVFGETFFEDGIGYPDTTVDGFEIVVPDDTLGRFVRVDLLGPNAGDEFFLSLAEVQVFSDLIGWPPAIVRQPVGARLAVGGSAAISVEAIGEAPLAYKWFKDGEEVQGATESTITFDPAEKDDAGEYYVVVSNAVDPTGVESDPVELVVTSKNLAPAGTAYQSTNYPGNVASRANDGNTDGVYGNASVSHTASGDPTPWWEVALGTEGTIEMIVLWNRTDCCSDRLTNFEVAVYDCSHDEVYTETFFEDGLGYPFPGEPFEIPLPPDTRGWYVRVSLLAPIPGREDQFMLSLAEVEVLGEALDPPPDPNLARKGTASQTSTNGSYTANLAIDGNLSNFTHTLTGVGTPPTWEVDLGGMHEIDYIVLHNRVDCCGSRLRDILVFVLDDQRDLVFDSDLLNPENELGVYPLGPETLTVDILAETGGAVTGQFVQVQRIPDPDLSGSGLQGNADEADVLSLAEVEVYMPVQCPTEGDTHCAGLTVTGPSDNRPGRYTLKADGKDDDCGLITYTFTGDNGIDPPIVVGPQLIDEAGIPLGIPGTWTVSVTVDDSARCTDEAADATCSVEIETAIDPDNVALLGTATQSTTGYNGAPERAIDGNVDGVYAGASIQHTADDDLAPWWEVDLGELYALDRIVIWNRTDACCMARLTNFRVSVLDDIRDPVFEEDFFTDGLGYPDTRDEGFEIPLPEGTEGQIVRVEVLGPNGTGTMFLNIAEVEVFKVSGPAGTPFRRGYVNADAILDLGDAITLLNFLFASGTTPTCVKSADVDDNGLLTIGDGINLLNFQFANGAPPAPPYAVCGTDPTPDALTCISSAACP
ncbi:MAG: discoidin domain-containing protein [Planctomycetes bacterium]|nr:discoidin domain-containing protein [Planctomycetota bacterium]